MARETVHKDAVAARLAKAKQNRHLLLEPRSGVRRLTASVRSAFVFNIVNIEFVVAITVLVFIIFPLQTQAVAASFGPYTIIRSLPIPPGGIGDLEYADGYLYSLESYNGNIHKLDPQTGVVMANYYVPGDSLHDDLPYDGPKGLASDGTQFYLATYAPNHLRTLSLGTPPHANVDHMASLPGWPMDLAYAQGLLYYPQYLGPILIVDPPTGTVLGQIKSPSDYVYGLTFDGQHLLAAYGPGGVSSGVIWVLSPSDGSILGTWNTGVNGIYGLAYDLDSETLYIGGSAGIIIADTRNPSPVPEPSSSGNLSAIGCLGLFCWLWRNRKAYVLSQWGHLSESTTSRDRKSRKTLPNKAIQRTS